MKLRSSDGPRRLLVYCADYKCAHVEIDADRWPDSQLNIGQGRMKEQRRRRYAPRRAEIAKMTTLVSHRHYGADIRPDFPARLTKEAAKRFN